MKIDFYLWVVNLCANRFVSQSSRRGLALFIAITLLSIYVSHAAINCVVLENVKTSPAIFPVVYMCPYKQRVFLLCLLVDIFLSLRPFI
jgi:hypothetical protein